MKNGAWLLLPGTSVALPLPSLPQTFIGQDSTDKNKDMFHSRYLLLACSELLSPIHSRFWKFLAVYYGTAEQLRAAWRRAKTPQLLQLWSPVGGLLWHAGVGVGRLESLIGTVGLQGILFWSLFSTLLVRQMVLPHTAAMTLPKATEPTNRGWKAHKLSREVNLPLLKLN